MFWLYHALPTFPTSLTSIYAWLCTFFPVTFQDQVVLPQMFSDVWSSTGTWLMGQGPHPSKNWPFLSQQLLKGNTSSANVVFHADLPMLGLCLTWVPWSCAYCHNCWVHMCNCPVVFKKYCLLQFCLRLLWSYHLLFPENCWVLEVGVRYIYPISG